jgi:hypothetical protein
MNITEMKVSELKVEEPYSSLFRIDFDTLSAIQKRMEKKGFDPSRPIDVWVGRNIVIDGHTRLKAAQNLGIESVPVTERYFKDGVAALDYAIRNQRERRNLTDADILHLVEKVDELFPQGGDRRSNFGNQKFDNPDAPMTDRQKIALKRDAGKTDRRQIVLAQDSRRITAEKIGISMDKVSQCRHILNNASDNEIEEINKGSKSLHQVYKASLAAVQNEKKRLDKQDEKIRIAKELSFEKFPMMGGREGKWMRKQFAQVTKKLDELVLKSLPSLRRQTREMYKIRQAVEFFKSESKKNEHRPIGFFFDSKYDFGMICEQVPIQKFLGSLFVADFIATLECFGYKIEKPSDMKIIEEKRSVKKRIISPYERLQDRKEQI